MVAIRNFFFGLNERWGKGLWLGALLALAAAGASLAEGIGDGAKPPLDDATTSGSTLSAAVPIPVVPVGAGAIDEQQTPSSAAATAPSGDEQQRRLFMLLLLNSAGPLRPYNGLSR